MFTKYYVCVVFLAVGLLLNGCKGGDANPSQPAATYSISGSVGTSGATIELTGAKTAQSISDAQGKFTFSGLVPGQYSLSTHKPFSVFSPLSVDATITSGSISSVTFQQQEPPEGLTADDLKYIDALPESYVPDDSIILPNGQSLSAYAKSRGFRLHQKDGRSSSSIVSSNNLELRANTPMPTTGPQQRKNDMIMQMVDEAVYLACGRRRIPCTDWDSPADLLDPIHKPAQRGLTYASGGRNPTIRTRPVDGCPQLTFGLDCSGLIFEIGSNVGLSVPMGSATQKPSQTQADPANWKIPADWQLKFKVVTDGSIEVGDLVAWPIKGHIGIAETNGSKVSANVISATGAPGQCATNVLPPKGPRSLRVSQLNVALGSPTVLRLVTTLSGDFDFYIRCTAQSTDAAVIRFKIDDDKGGPFSATGTGIDYTGLPLSFKLNGTYDQLSNTVTATIAFTDGTRSDSFSVKLLDDDTGYFPLTKVIDNRGCVASGRLVRAGTASSSSSAMFAPPARRHGTPGLSLLPPRQP